MDTQGWYEVIEFAPDTYQISEAGRWNMFLLVGEEKALSLDGGIGVGSVRRLCESITDLPVEHVLTHTHWDHVGAAHEWESVGVHPGGKDKLANDYTAGCRDFVETWERNTLSRRVRPRHLHHTARKVRLGGVRR